MTINYNKIHLIRFFPLLSNPLLLSDLDPTGLPLLRAATGRSQVSQVPTLPVQRGRWAWAVNGTAPKDPGY